MPMWLKVAGKWGSIFAVIALVMTLLRQAIAFIGFLTVAIKVLIVFGFIGLLIGVGLLIVKSKNASKSNNG